MFYRPPSSDEEYLEQLQENMNSLEQNTDIILVGDFNLKEVDWNRNLMLNNSRLYEIFSGILLDNFLTQMVLQPTRAGNILDLVLSNSADIIQDVQVGEPISDHNVVTFNANVYPYRRKHTKKEFYNFKKADWEQLNTLFEIIPWDCAFLSQDIHVVWRAWLDLFNTAVDKCIPKRTKSKHNRPPWISDEILQLIRKKRIMYRKAKRLNRNDLWSSYKNLNNLVKKKCNEARWRYLDKLANDLNNKDNKKLFWNYVASKHKGTNDLISLKADGNKVITSDLGIAQEMNDYFSSMFTDEDLQSLPSFESAINNGELASITCSPEEVSTLLSELKQNKSPGPDEIHPMILKKCSRTLANSLCELFNMSFAQGCCTRSVETGRYCTFIQKRSEGSSRELSTSVTHVYC